LFYLSKYLFDEDVHGILNLTDEKCLSAIYIFISALNKEILFAIDGLKQFVVPRETKPNLKEYVKFRADYHLLQSVTDACFTNLQMLTQAINVVSCSECNGIFK
jgi:hypothetical protein